MINLNAMKYRIPVLKRLIPSARKFYCQIFWPGGFGMVRSHGARFRLNYLNFVDRQIAFYGDYEDRQLTYLTSELTRMKADTFIDIGANIGFYAVIIAKAGLIDNVIAFEPDERNIKRLRENILLNELEDTIQVHQFAAGSEAGELTFHPGPENSTGQSKIAADGEISVPVVAIDDFLSLHNSRIGVKIDVEGFELEVLTGMERTLRDNECLLQIEIYQDNIPLVTDFLAGIGYGQKHLIDHDYFFAR
jgi:FkbM family methyltransferase